MRYALPVAALLCGGAWFACNPFSVDCDEKEVVSCLEAACAAGRLLPAECACVKKGQTLDSIGCGCKPPGELTVCTDGVVCSEIEKTAKLDAETSDCQGTCETDSGCDHGTICDAPTHNCVPGCRHDYDCDIEQRCADLMCVALTPCETDADCEAEGRSCVLKLCR